MSLSSSRLEHVAALAEQGSFGKAAAALGISQPALSKSIQALEAELRVRLFDRHTRGVEPTEFGRLVVAHARQLAARDGDLRREIQLLAGLEVGQLDVALGPFPSVISGYAVADHMIAAHPKLHLALHVANWREVTRAVAERRVELGVAELTDALLNNELDTELVGQHRAKVFCRPGHPLLRAPRVGLPALFGYPWAQTRLPPRIATGFPRGPLPAGRFDEATGDFVPALKTDVPMQLAQLVGGSDVLAFGALSMVERDLDAGRLAWLPTPEVEMRASYGFIYLRGRSLSPAALAFMQAMRDEEARLAEREAQLERRYGENQARAGVSVRTRADAGR